MSDRYFDPRPPAKQIADSICVWTYIIGLSVMLVCWALLAWAAIGNATITHPDYNLPDITPAAQPYNTIGDYQRPQR